MSSPKSVSVKLNHPRASNHFSEKTKHLQGAHDDRVVEITDQCRLQAVCASEKLIKIIFNFKITGNVY